MIYKKTGGKSSFEQLTNSTWHHFPLFNRCLQPAFPIVSSTIPDCISRPYPDYVPDCVPDRFPDYVTHRLPDPFHDTVPPRNCGIPSRSVNQMGSRLPVRFPSRGKQTATFSHTVAREDPKKIRLRRAERLQCRTDQCLGYRSYPWKTDCTQHNTATAPTRHSLPVRRQNTTNVCCYMYCCTAVAHKWWLGCSLGGGVNRWVFRWVGGWVGVVSYMGECYCCCYLKIPACQTAV